MQKPTDERLIAYLDGEVDDAEREFIAEALERDPSLRDREAAFAESGALIRAAFDSVLHEEIPERLIRAAHGEPSTGVADFAAAQRRRFSLRRWSDHRVWLGAGVAASLLCLLIGAGGGYFAANEPVLAGKETASNANIAANWLDNVAGYHKLLINAGANEVGLVDVPANNEGEGARKVVQKLPADFHLPNLKPWGLEFQGARYLIIEGRPATQLFYTTDNKKLGPITIVVGSSSKSDLAPTMDHRDDMNMLYWRHQGHAYALVGTADIGYLWNIAKDIAWQFDAI